jgi:hypothetical protein
VIKPCCEGIADRNDHNWDRCDRPLAAKAQGVKATAMTATSRRINSAGWHLHSPTGFRNRTYGALNVSRKPSRSSWGKGVLI